MNPKERAVATYDAAADHYDDDALSFWARIGRRTVERIRLPQGARVLDVCCGTGASALPAAEAVGPSGSVVAVDLAANQLARGREKARCQGLSHIVFRQSDVEQLDVDDGSFDAVICVFGIFFLADMAAGFRQLWRLVRPGGVLAITTWGPGLFEPANTVFWESVREYQADLYKSFNPWDDVDTPEKLLALFNEAGVPRAECVAESGNHPVARAEDWWTIALGSGFRGTIDQLSPEVAEDVRERCVTYLRDHDATMLATNAVYGLARRPD